MMLRSVLRSNSALATKRAVAALSSLLYNHIPSPTGNGPLHYVNAAQINAEYAKLEFRSTMASHAGSAVSDSWCDDETIVDSKDGGDGLSIEKLGISEEIVSALAGRGITKLFPIQKAVLEPAMSGRDMYGRARTGTGKTLAFGIPILNKIIHYNKKHGKGKYPLALVLAPTRELARQVEKEFHDSAPSLDMICVYGGTPIYRQMSELNYGVDVVVGTPGRVIDLMKRGSLNLEEVQFVVIDEADQMLSVGFVDDVETIFQRLPDSRQSMLFSATMPSWIRNLIRKYLKNPLTIDLVGEDDQKLADGISLYSIAADMYGKAAILCPLITEHAKGGKCIIFTQTKRDADRLATALSRKLKCEALHGDISQAVRERTLSGFRSGFFNVLVATDVAARGLDIPNVDLVVHYEIPNSSETFVHRSGRTGRAGKKGTAILIYTEDQARQKKIFEREVGCRFTELPKIAVDGSEMDFSSRFGSDRHSSSKRFDDFGDRGSSRSFRSSGSGGRFGERSDRFGYNSARQGSSGRDSERFGGFLDYAQGRSERFGDDSKRNVTFGEFENRKRSFQ